MILQKTLFLSVIFNLFLISSLRASSCVECHPHAPFSCSGCHRGCEDQNNQAEAHEGLVTNPADFSNSGFVCGRCHNKQTHRVSQSLMNTMAGIINPTRYLWGAQPDPGPRYAVKAIKGLSALPGADGSGRLVDDLLRRRCLRCHPGIKGTGGYGEYRAAGCAACHMLYEDTGSGPNRKSLLPGERGRPMAHRLTTAIPTSQCLHCHHGNRVGADYVGLFERDQYYAYNFEDTDPWQPQLVYGQTHHRLLPDIHHERGMHCIDCHPVEEIMGDGKIHSCSADQVGIRCTDCHGLPGKPPETVEVTSADTRVLKRADTNENYILSPGQKVIITSKGHLLANTSEKNGKFFLTSKVDGRIHPIPILGLPGTGPLNHNIPGHLDRMACTACHAAWSFQDLGLHLIRLDRPDYGPWARLMRQSDPQARKTLEQNLVKSPEQWRYPVSRDWLTGVSRPGIWLGGYSLRRWEGRILGINNRKRISIMRPQHQYWVSHVDANGQVRLDSVIPRTTDGRQALAWNPYAPHTIRRRTAACWDCHGNSRTLGLGRILIRAKDNKAYGLTRPFADGLGIAFELDQVIDTQGQAFQITSRPETNFIDKNTLKRMSERNPLYVKYLLEYYRGKEAYGDPRGFTGPDR